ncbi:MAG: arginase [Acidobacteriia bacterium]|nr:arginase [Terriglobia bacterium]
MRPSHIAIIGAPLDLGAGRRGVDMGPSAVRVANLNGRIASLGYAVEDLGNVEVAQPETTSEGDTNAKYLPQIAATCERLAEAVANSLAHGMLPLALGGDHSIAVGTASGISHHFRQQGRKIGILWLDAHADMNTPATSPSGNIHGMPLACVLGFGPPELTGLLGYVPKIDPQNAVIIGARDIDEREKLNVRESGVSVFTMRDIDERGLRSVMEAALQTVLDGTAGFCLSLDMDFVDPKDAPGVGTPVRGGVTYREAHLAMEMICDCGQMVAMEVVEVNPVIDEVNRTADLAVELMTSALGKRIL